jgi:hypothetical protein
MQKYIIFGKTSHEISAGVELNLITNLISSEKQSLQSLRL